MAIVGVGGLGSTLFQTLVGMGVGQDGWITVVDSDHLDQSNVPRIPYATSEDVGHPKVNLALRYAAQKNPGFSIKIEKIYREKDSNEYRSTQYFFTNELADLEDAARLARQYVRGCALQDTLEESNASAELEPVAE